MAWIGSTIGLSVSSPQVASTAGFAWLFPLTFLSNAFVPSETLPTWLRFFAEWNPITSIVAAERFWLVSREEAVHATMDVYSPDSPLGNAVIGKKQGDKSSFSLPSGKEITISIKKVETYQA